MLFRMALRNVRRGWRRAGLVMLACAVGITGCLLMLAWMNGMFFQMIDNAVETQLGDLAVQAEGYHEDPDVKHTLDPAPVLRVMEEGGLRASARVRGEGLIQTARKNTRAAIVGVVPARESSVSTVPASMVDGHFLTGPSRGRLRPIVIGREMATILDVEVRDKLVVRVPGESDAGAFRVRGIYRTASTEFDKVVVYLRLADAQELFGTDGGATEVVVALDERSEAELARTKAWLAERVPGGLEVLRWDERAPRLAAMLQVMGQIGWIFYALIFVAMAFGIANAMLMAVFERMREFGVMRSLGLRPTRLFLLILLESGALTLAGTALGIGAGFLIVGWLRQTGIDLSAFATALEDIGAGSVIYPRITVDDVIVPVGLALVTGVIAAAWPGRKAVQIRPAAAMRRT